MSTPHQDKQRLDKWLWAARFFKTRSLAVDAIKGGKVSLNGQRAKPGKEIQVGASLDIRLGMFVTEVIVCKLSQQRGPAQKAQTLYEETEPSQLKNRALKEQLKNQAVDVSQHYLAQHKGRPNKRDRKKIIQFTRKAKLD